MAYQAKSLQNCLCCWQVCVVLWPFCRGTFGGHASILWVVAPVGWQCMPYG